MKDAVWKLEKLRSVSELMRLLKVDVRKRSAVPGRKTRKTDLKNRRS